MNSVIKVIRRLQEIYYPHLLSTQKKQFSTEKKEESSPHSSPSLSRNEQSQDASPSKRSTSNKKDAKKKGPQKTLKLSPEAQRAVWASKVIKQISRASSPVKIQQSLRKKIINARINTGKYEFTLEDTFKKQIMQMLTIGIPIDQSVFDQERIQRALYKDAKGVSRLIFYPTTTVSKLVFNRLLNKSSCVFLGSFGIGKTISMVFFIHLAMHINKLKYLSYAEWVPKEQRQKFHAQYQLLNKHELLVNAPKCWYWSIHLELKDDQDTVMQLIKLQTQEMCLSEEYKKKIGQFKTLDELTKFFFRLQYHSRKIHSIMIYNQINVLVSCLRKWNQAVDRHDSAKSAYMAEQDLNQARKRFLIPFQRTKQLIDSTKHIQNFYILNSSILVQPDLLYDKKQDDFSKKLQLGFGKHGGPSKEIIEFNQKMKENSGRIQYSQLLLELIEEKCKRMGVMSENIKKIRSVFTPQTIQVEKYHRFLFIRQYLKLEQDKFPEGSSDQTLIQLKKSIKKIEHIFHSLITKQTGLTQIKSILANLNKDYHNFCILRCQIILVSYMNKGKDKNEATSRRLIIHQIRNKAKQLQALNKDKADIQLSISIQQLQKKIQSYTFKPVKSILNTFIQGKKYNQIIPCKVEGGSIIFEWSVKDFLDISLDVDEFQVKIQKFQLADVDPSMRKFFLQVPPANGYFGEFLLRKIILQSNKVKFLSYRMEQGQIKKAYQQFQMYPYSGIFPAFDSNLRTQKVTLRNDLKTLIDQAKLAPNKNIIGTPHYESKKDKEKQQPMLKFAYHNKSVDFIMVKYSDQQDMLFITTFDVTVSTKKDIIKKKGKQSLSMLKSLVKTDYDPKDKNVYSIKHVIICPEEGCIDSQDQILQLSKDYLPIRFECFPIGGFTCDSSNQTYNQKFKTWKWMVDLQHTNEIDYQQK